MCLKIREHLDIQISYKILRLELSRLLSFVGFSACFRGCVLAVFMKYKVGPLGVNKIKWIIE